MNKPQLDPNAFSDTVIRQVEYEVANVSKRYGLDFKTEEDLRQDLYLALIKRREKYDPKYGQNLNSYLYMVLKSAVKNWLTQQNRKKKSLVEYTLDEPMPEGEVSKVELVRKDESEERAADLRKAVREAVMLMEDGENKRIMKLFMKGWSKKRIRKALGYSESDFKRKILPKAIEDFQKNYLP